MAELRRAGQGYISTHVHLVFLFPVDDHSTQDHLSINVNFTMPSCFSFLTKTRPRHPKDGAWAWLVLCYVSFCAVSQGTILYGFGIIVPVLMADLEENRERIGKHFFQYYRISCRYVF